MSEHVHKMVLETTHPSGAEEWACPECGRRFVAQWVPKFRRVVLKHGNARTIHTGQDVELGVEISTDVTSQDIPHHIELDDVWKQWLDKKGFDQEDDDKPVDP